MFENEPNVQTTALRLFSLSCLTQCLLYAALLSSILSLGNSTSHSQDEAQQ